MVDPHRNNWRPAASLAHLLPLEPRMMFDAAAVATTDAVTGAAFADRDAGQHDQATHADPHLAAFAPTEFERSAPTQASGPSREIIFIDTSVADYRALAALWAQRGEVVLVDAGANGVDQLQTALAGRTDVSAIHIVSHGTAGSLSLGTSRIDQAGIEGAFASSLAAIGRSLTPDGDILIYGCDFAQGDAGARAIESLARATDADIAASTDLTGAAARGGDWTLEAERGAIEAHALDGGDWNHLLAPVPIAVTPDSLTVRDSNGTVVASGGTGYTTVIGAQRSALVGAGATATWTNASTFNGQAVDLRATIVSVSTGDQVRFDRPTSASDDAAFLLQSTAGTGNATLQLRWELLLSGTNTPLAADVRFTVADIDGVGGNPRTRETLIVSTENLSYFTREQVSDIRFTASLSQVEASGTQNETASPPLPISAASFDWTDVSAFTITYQLNRAGSAQAAFFHDGDADFVFNDPRYVSIPRLDLDADDSTASGTGAALTYTENAAPIMVVDGDLRVDNPAGQVVSATVTLTNAKAGDALSVGTLPPGISGAVDTSVAGTIRVTLTGAASAADYETAIKAVSFANSSDAPDTTTRAVNVTFSNDTLTSDVATSLISIVEVNDAPVAQPDSATTPEDVAVTIPVLANDSDPDGDPLTVTAATALNGSVTINGDGTLTYNPNANYNGPDTISYTISDGRGGTASSTVAITVTPVNDAPVAVGTLPPRNANDATTVSYATAGAFADVDDATLVYSASGLPDGLTIDAATGLIAGTLGRSASQPNGGVYTVSVTARDAAGASATQSFILTVANPGPSATNDSVTTDEDTSVTIAVLANDSDPDGDPLRVIAASALNGSVTINADGTLTYRPNANYNGADTISYTISDDEGGTASTTVAVTITPVADAPVAVGTLPASSSSDGAAFSLATAASFADADGDPLSYSATGLPAGLTIDPATGVISGTIDGSASQIGGGVYAVIVTARDPSNAAASQSFTLTVDNPAPIAADDAVRTHVDTPLTIAVLANDYDPDGDQINVTAAVAARGNVSINPDGTLAYRPPSGFAGTDTITYTISDGQGGTANATVTVTIENAAPTATAITPQSAADGQALTLNAGAAFADSDGDALTFSATGLPPGLTIDAVSGIITGTIDRSASQVSGGGYASIVTADDGHGGRTSATIEWTITNPAPIAADDGVVTSEDVAITIAPLANDNDPDGDPLTIVAASAGRGTVTINPDGTLTYTPDRDVNGSDTITYTVSDSEGGTATARVNVTILPVEDAPVSAGIGPRSDPSASAVSVPLGASFSDPDGDPLTFTATGLPPGLSIDPVTGLVSGTIAPGSAYGGSGRDGVFAATVTATDPSGRAVTTSFLWTVTQVAPIARDDAGTTRENVAILIPVLDNDSDGDLDPLTIVEAGSDDGAAAIEAGAIRFTPAPGSTGAATIRYVISDPAGNRATAIVTIEVRVGNDPPIATGTLPAQTVQDGASASIGTAIAFSDPDGDTLAYTAINLPAGLTIDPATGLISGTLDRAASQVGGGRYEVIITARDPSGASASQTLVLNVTNPAPVAVADSATVARDTVTTIAVLPNDFDPDGDPITVVSATAENGSVAINADGTLSYTPRAGFTGPDRIVYTISDGQGGSDSAAVSITVGAASRPPSAEPLANVAAFDGSAIAIAAGAAFTDPDGDTLVFSATGLPAGLTIDPRTGAISGTLDGSASQNGPYAIVVTATDPVGLSDSTGFVLTAANVAPIANDDVAVVQAGGTAIVPVLANDIDPDGDPLIVSAASAANGTVLVRPDGTIAYTPRAGFVGADTIDYTISDGQGGNARATVTVTVIGGSAPLASPIVGAFARDGAAVTIATGTAFTDPDGDPLLFTATGLPTGLAIDPRTGEISGTLGSSASRGGPYRIVVTATDPSGASAESAFTLSVTNPAPLTRDDFARVAENQVVTIPVLDNDSDPDGDPLTVTGATAGSGSVTINRDGTISYRPGPNFAGMDIIRYTVVDSDGASAQASVTVTVDPVNDAPIIAGRDPVLAIGGRPISIDPLAGVSDADGDPLRVIEASVANGAVSITPEGLLRYAPALGFVGDTTIRFTVSDGRGGVSTGVIVVRVADGRGADITQLLRIRGHALVDPGPRFAQLSLSDGVGRNPMALLQTADSMRSLRSTRLDAEHPLLGAIEAARSLRGVGALDPDMPILREVARERAIGDFRAAGDRLFDQRWGDFLVEGASGFSAAADRNAGIMFESVVRDGTIFVEVRDTAADNHAPLRSVSAALAGGGKVPEWIRVDPAGLIIIERAADQDEIHLTIRTTRADGRTSTTPVVIQGATGEIELDRTSASPPRARAAPLDATLHSARAAADAAAARLAATFD